MRREDPLPRPQLAVPLKLVKKAARRAKKEGNSKTLAMADLIIIAFFYLLRSGEYTNSCYVHRNRKRIKATRTVQFRIKDIGFFNNSFAIDKFTASLSDLLQATSATLLLGN